MIFNSPVTLVKSVRDGLVDEQHLGYFLLMNHDNIILKLGESANYPYYLRSCAKPLQAALLVDFGLDKYFDLNAQEIALCCASHAGEDIHINLAENLLNKFDLKVEDLKCGIHEPLSKTMKNKMLLHGEKPTALHNNCSGKHLMMLGLCRLKGWDIKNYDDINHPLQVAIKNKIYELCELNQEYPATTDGCGVPIYSMPFENMCKGYLNLFCNKNYSVITNAILKNPYVLGGEDRTDTKIIQNSDSIVAKVGAGGLCIVVNIKTQESMLVKISDCDMKARELFIISALRKFGWADIPVDYSIMTLHGQVVGKFEICL